MSETATIHCGACHRPLSPLSSNCKACGHDAADWITAECAETRKAVSICRLEAWARSHAIKFAILILSAVTYLHGAEPYHWQVDGADEWSNPMYSHHYKHFIGGTFMGFAGFALTDLATDSRPASYVTSITAGAIYSIGYEVYMSRHGTCWVDPVDASYSILGTILGAALADATGSLFTIVTGNKSAALAFNARF